MTHKYILSLAALLLGLFWTCLASAQLNPGVTVFASQELRRDGTVRYHYQMTNHSARAVVALLIGSDYYHGTAELDAYPLGWSANGAVPEGHVSAPHGWNTSVVTTEESPFVEIEWRNDGHADVQPGQSQAGFAVIVARPNARYLSSHWTVLFADGTAASDLLLANGQPRIVAKLVGATLLAPERWAVTLLLSNQGGGTASNVALLNVTGRILAGSGQVSLVEPAPAVGDLAPGTSTTLQLQLNVPVSVRKVALSETGTLSVASGATVKFSAAQVFYPKN